VYKRDIDGRSLYTFYSKAEEYKSTFLVVKDEHGYVFGGYCNEPWECKYRFFGTEDTFLFTFRDG